MNAAAAAAAVVLAAWLVTRPAQAAFYAPWSDVPDADTPDEPDQLPTLWEQTMSAMDPSTYTTGTLPGDLADANERAFLDMLAVSEGTKGRGNDGYNVLFGGALFTSYADHPRRLITRTFGNGTTVTSSAAGRYQFLRRTWDELASTLRLGDFGPPSQDRAALELIRQRGALADVRAGRFAAAVDKCRRTWASLPGAGYDQPEQPIERLAAAYVAAGGTFA